MLSIDDKAPAVTAVTAEEVAARAAVMEIPLYPELPVILKKALGYGPHVDIVQHLVYWFHPRHPKMQNRWDLYKTFDEWYEECGLTDRQVKKGRKKLWELGVLTWNRRQNGRVWYCVHWLALANLLNLLNPDGVGVPIEDFDDPFEDLNPDGVGVPFNPDGVGVPFNPDALPSDPIQKTTQESTSEDYSQESSPLQGGAEPAFAEPAPREINNDFEDLEELSSSQPVNDKRHSQDGVTQDEEQAPREEVDEPKAPPLPDDARLLAEVREVLDPDSGRWSRVYAENVRKNYGQSSAYSPDRLAGYLAGDVDLPYAGRKADLVPCLRYVFWEWSNETQTREVAA